MEWIPEAYPRAGGLAAAGFYKLLGRPRMDPLSVLVRETAQNSWDARARDDLAVQFTIEGWQLEPQERKALLDSVFRDAKKARGTGLAEELASPGLTGIYICDRNTKGLGGPLSADEADPDDTYDWVDFVLNVGKANTAGHTGGTYGFGKTISYVVSSANAVVIHSRTRYRGRVQTRLIACAIGDEFKLGGRLFTGRHWWGKNRDGAPEPVTGGEADRLARAIGMPEFRGDELGTNLLIVAPDLGGRTPDQAMTFVAESVTWHLWPKLVPRRDFQPMEMGVYWNGKGVEIPAPESRPPLQGFAQAFQALLEGADQDDIPVGTKVEQLRCGRPNTVVGRLATVPLVHRERALVDDGHFPDDNDSPAPAAVITGPCHHVALLRTPELVIEYMEGPAPTEGGTEWAGVFRAEDEHDGHFAAAEPPTHDTWNPSLLPKSPGRTIVNVGLREIRTALEARWARRTRVQDVNSMSTAYIADELSHLVRTVDGRGPGRRRREAVPGAGSRKRTAKVDVVHTGPVIHDGAIATQARLLVTPASGAERTRLHLAVGAALDGSAIDKDLDPSLSLAEVRFAEQVVPASGLTEQIDIQGQKPVEVELIVRRGSDITVLFDIQAEQV